MNGKGENIVSENAKRFEYFSLKNVANMTFLKTIAL